MLTIVLSRLQGRAKAADIFPQRSFGGSVGWWACFLKSVTLAPGEKGQYVFHDLDEVIAPGGAPAVGNESFGFASM